MNNKKRKNWDFYEIKVENKMRNFNHDSKNTLTYALTKGFQKQGL